MERRDFLKFGALLAAVAADEVLLGGCARRLEPKPFVLSPEKTEAGPGFATADFSATAVDVYIPINDLGGSDADLVFGSESVNRGGMEHLLGGQSFHTAPDWWKLVDHDKVKPILSKRVTLTDIRFNYLDPTLIRVVGDAPQMVGGKPDEVLPWQPTALSLAVQSGGDWLAGLSPFGSSEVSPHVVSTIQAIGSRIRRPGIVTPVEIIFAGTIVPKRYTAEMQSSLDLHKGLTNAVNAARDVSNLEGASIPDDLYVNTYDAGGRVNPSLRLPMGLKVGIEAIHQLKDGRVLGLVKPRRESILLGYTPGDGGLIDDATDSTRMPTDLVWVDMTEFWTEPDQLADAAVRQEMVAQGTPRDVVATKRAAFPTATQTATAPPSPTATPRPTSTPPPTATESQSFTGWQPTAVGPTVTEVPGGANEKIAQSDPWNIILTAACTVSGLATLGTAGWVVRDYVSKRLQEKIERENSYQRYMDILTPRAQAEVYVPPIQKKGETPAPAPLSREERHSEIVRVTREQNNKISQLQTLKNHGHDKDQHQGYYESVKEELASLESQLKALQSGESPAQPEFHDQI